MVRANLDHLGMLGENVVASEDRDEQGVDRWWSDQTAKART